MLVIDDHILGQVHALDLFDQVPLHLGRAFDPEDILGHLVSVCEGLPMNHIVALGDAEVLSRRDHMLIDLAIRRDHIDDRLASLLLPHLDDTIDLRYHCWILRLSNLEDFRHPRQSTGDVLGTRNLSR